MAMVEKVRVYRSVDKYFVAANYEDSKQFAVEVLNTPNIYPEEVDTRFWFTDALVKALDLAMSSKLKGKFFTIKGLPLYRLKELPPKLEVRKGEIDLEDEPDTFYEYFFSAESQAVALDYILKLSVVPDEVTNAFTISTISLETILTRIAAEIIFSEVAAETN